MRQANKNMSAVWEQSTERGGRREAGVRRVWWRGVRGKENRKTADGRQSRGILNIRNGPEGSKALRT